MQNDENRLEWRLGLIQDLLAEIVPLAWASPEAAGQAADIIHAALSNVKPKRGVDYAAILNRRYTDGEDFATVGDGRRERGRTRVARGLRMLRWQLRERGGLDELQACVKVGE